jgi:hypothetical protein
MNNGKIQNPHFLIFTISLGSTWAAGSLMASSYKTPQTLLVFLWWAQLDVAGRCELPACPEHTIVVGDSVVAA